MNAEEAARLFHETYERLAPKFNYEPRKESRILWEEVPYPNRCLMVATCEEILPKVQGPLLDAMALGEKELLAKRDAVYRERDACVAAMAKMALLLGYRCGLGKHSEADETWDREWMNIVYIEVPRPSGKPAQLSWHIHENELPLFSFLPPYDEHWDGHSTEEKYQHMAEFCRG